jgi:hypothetical protein
MRRVSADPGSSAPGDYARRYRYDGHACDDGIRLNHPTLQGSNRTVLGLLFE